MRLASGIMRYPEIQVAGIRIGLGLDGGTNDTIDMFNNMRAATGLQRAKSVDAHATPTIVEVLRAATMGGAEVLDMESQIGSLTPGKQADVIVIDPRSVQLRPGVRRSPSSSSTASPRSPVGVRRRPATQVERQGDGRERARR